MGTPASPDTSPFQELRWGWLEEPLRKRKLDSGPIPDPEMGSLLAEKGMAQILQIGLAKGLPCPRTHTALNPGK